MSWDRDWKKTLIKESNYKICKQYFFIFKAIIWGEKLRIIEWNKMDFKKVKNLNMFIGLRNNKLRR